MKRICMLCMLILVGCSAQEAKVSSEPVYGDTTITWIEPVHKDISVCFEAYMEKGEQEHEANIEQLYKQLSVVKELLNGYTIEEANIAQVATKESGSVYYGLISAKKDSQHITISIVHQSSLEAKYWLNKYDIKIKEPMIYAFEEQHEIHAYLFDQSYIFDITMSGFTKVQVEAWLNLLTE